MTQSIAIVERLPGHTEDMGAFAALALDLRHDPHLLYETGDQFHMVDYFRTRLRLSDDKIAEWSNINDPGSHFDVILLNTSFTWLDYRLVLEEWNARKRLIVVHHHPDDAELNPYGAPVYLTPVAGEERWIFPLYSEPAAPEGLGLDGTSLPPLDPAELPALTTLGQFEGKDVAGAHAYLQAGGRLVHYDRYRCRFFSADDKLYTQHIGLGGVHMMTSLAEQRKPLFIWLPIVFPSDYLVCRFTAALIVGVEMNGIMVMPERLRKFYGFPEDAVITYDASVTEPECLGKLRASPADQHKRQRQLGKWAVERWRKNLAVFQALLEGPGPAA
ncbi:MAG: hypothetical protein ACLQVG_31355 [Terriglobia bacterium]